MGELNRVRDRVRDPNVGKLDLPCSSELLPRLFGEHWVGHKHTDGLGTTGLQGLHKQKDEIMMKQTQRGWG